MGDSFQVHVFKDLGRKMMPGCKDCMCYIHGENNGFGVISLFPLSQYLGVPGAVLGAFLVTFGDLWGTFSDLGGSWGEA